MGLFGKNTAKKICISTLIDSDTRIEGSIYCSTPLKLDGTVNGSVNATSDVIIGQTATVNGDLFVNDVIISGIVNGDVISNETVSLTASAKVNGNVTTTGLVVDNGCKFEGKCNIIQKIDKPALSDKPIELEGILQKNEEATEEQAADTTESAQ